MYIPESAGLEHSLYRNRPITKWSPCTHNTDVKSQKLPTSMLEPSNTCLEDIFIDFYDYPGVYEIRQSWKGSNMASSLFTGFCFFHHPQHPFWLHKALPNNTSNNNFSMTELYLTWGNDGCLSLFLSVWLGKVWLTQTFYFILTSILFSRTHSHWLIICKTKSFESHAYWACRVLNRTYKLLRRAHANSQLHVWWWM